MSAESQIDFDRIMGSETKDARLMRWGSRACVGFAIGIGVFAGFLIGRGDVLIGATNLITMASFLINARTLGRMADWR